MTPTGKRKQAAAVLIPVKEVTTADPPVNNIAVTLPHNQYQSPQTTHIVIHHNLQDISTQSKEHERHMRPSTVSRSDNLQKSMRIGRLPLELNGQCRKQQDLHCRTARIPERARNSVLVCDS